MKSFQALGEPRKSKHLPTLPQPNLRKVRTLSPPRNTRHRVRRHAKPRKDPELAEIHQGIASLEQDIDFFLTEIDRELQLGHSHRWPQPPPLPTEESSEPSADLSMTKAVVDAKLVDRLRQRMRSTPTELPNTLTNFFKLSKTTDPPGRPPLVTSIQRNMHEIKKPCIDQVFTRVQRKQSIYTHYRGSRRWDTSSPEGRFTRGCIEHKTAPVPVLAYVKEQQLVLTRYRMYESLCGGVKAALPALSLLTLSLDRCGITDAGGATLLEGIAAQQTLEEFKYTYNAVGQHFVAALNLLPARSALKTLDLSGCKGSTSVVVGVTQNVYRLRSLRKLGLSQLGLNNAAMENLTRLVKRRKLEDLDISWNHITVESALEFFRALEKNKHLQYLDYSWNQFGTPHGTPHITLASSLSNTIRKHPSLFHINLSYTQLSDFDATALAVGLGKSKSLMVLHCTGNLLTNEGLATLTQAFSASIEEAFIADSATGATNPFVGDYAAERPRRKVYGETLSGTAKEIDSYLAGDKQERIFSRVLRAPQVPEGDKWKLTEHCWVCERWDFHSFKLNKQNLSCVTSVQNPWAGDQYILKGTFNQWKGVAFKDKEEEISLTLLLPPGKHRLWIFNKDELLTTKQRTSKHWDGLRVNEIYVLARDQPVSLDEDRMKRQVRRFVKERSVFCTFIEDNAEVRSRMFKYDSRYSKLDRMIKNKDEVAAVNQVLFKYFADIKEIFEDLISESNYPTITMLDFSRFCENARLFDSNINNSTLDRLFIASTYQVEKVGDNPERELCRFEFFEILVRVAAVKYPGVTQANAIELLIKEYLLKYARFSRAASFRKEHLYTLEVNDLLEANLATLQTLFMRHKENNPRWMSMASAQSMFSGFHFPDFVKCFAFSKMSIVEDLHSDGAYKKMSFVEFLEFLGRAAHCLYDGAYPLRFKLERMLTKLFERFNLVLRFPVEMRNEDESESD